MKRALIAAASGLVLADAAVVTLALPPILLELDTTVEGVAAVIAVYTAVLALGLPLAAALHGRATGPAGALLFAAASIGCASADSLELLLAMRALQALGGAALLTAAFDAIDGGGSGRRLWIGAAVAGTAAGPALGGLLTELFEWQAIFIAQAPVALAAAPALLGAPMATMRDHVELPRRDLLAGVALALLSGALTAVVFLLVLLLTSGWSVEPLAAAAAVSVLPVAAVAGSFVRAPAATRAAAGCVLVAGGIACLALLPEASALWTIVPQILAGVGMGMAFPALAGELLPERTRGQAAGLLSLRHAGITLALVALAPLVAAELDQQVELARERGTAVVLDAALPPTDKIALAPRLFAEIETEDPRDALARAVARERRRVGREDGDLMSRLEQLEGQLGADTGGLLGELEELEDKYGGGLLDDLNERLGGNSSPDELRAELDVLADELDEVVLAAVDAAFSPAFAIAGGMALLAAMVLLPGRRRGLRAGAIGAAVALALAVPGVYAIARTELEPEPVEIADPCEDRERDSVGGVEGAAEEVALAALDRAACEFGSSREELVLALFDDESRRAYERQHGVDPRSLDELLRGVVGL
ncbi:MAG TPA: MFS transporter [Thermoleophilaceae bacterium]|nr:MFS transporter [Thermoleophilaceae bacterium]